MPDYMTDAELVLCAILQQVAVWEPAAGRPISSGTLRFNGVGHWINLKGNLPKIPVTLRRELIEVLAPR